MFHDHQPEHSARAADTVSRPANASASAERRFRALVEYASDAIVLLSPDGALRYVNPASRHVLGYPSDELIGSNLFTYVHEDDRDALATAVQSVVSGGRGHHVDIAFRSQTRAGYWRLHDATLQNLIDEPDVAAIALTARPFDSAEDVLERLNQTQRIEGIARLAGGVAHDYNNLLTVVTANAQMLLGSTDLDAESRAAIEDIEVAAGRAADLTRQLLAFSRQQILRLEPVALDAQLQELAPRIQALAGPGIQVVIDAESGGCTVLADDRQLQYVILNLAQNAREAMPGGGHLRIECVPLTLTAEQAARHAPMTPGAYVRLRVSDTGVGMDAATRARAFEPFFTTKERGKGTGLGLAMAYGIVKQLGGFIWVDSVPGAGSAFTVYLPTASVDDTTRRIDRPTPSSSPAVRARVLVVEDEELVRRMTQRTLERVGYQVTVARSAEEALDLVRGGMPNLDLLLTDIVMPGMNGRDLARTIATERPGTRVLLMSGYAHFRALFERQADDTPFLQKPFTVEQLLSRVREVLAAAVAVP
ncbi:MAG: response regulator [Gemmatimonadaceae bacterium]